ncbi:hypothetical protein PybrP1_008984 [[Pythium] brassicae (nom. inval.)]|nr:hypothetical protein PybrP1_008984 [[Pythium] brassicae (nom. inval.)]
MRFAIVQYEPKIGQVARNMAYVDDMIASLSADDGIDMAMTGYVFEARAQVELLAEVAGAGATFAWCQRHARRLQCMVLCGYVEKESEDAAHGRLYNAMMVVSPTGALACNPRKTFLYETDKVWATAGGGFSTWHCPWLDRTISFGICMDINPHEFTAPFSAFEFATQVVAHGSDLVLFSCAWCDHNRDETETYPTLSYWATRLTPIVRALQQREFAKPACFFLCANRVGEENGTHFAGASCAMSLEEPALLAHASRTEECVLRVDIPL